MNGWEMDSRLRGNDGDGWKAVIRRMHDKVQELGRQLLVRFKLTNEGSGPTLLLDPTNLSNIRKGRETGQAATACSSSGSLSIGSLSRAFNQSAPISISNSGGSKRSRPEPG